VVVKQVASIKRQNDKTFRDEVVVEQRVTNGLEEIQEKEKEIDNIYKIEAMKNQCRRRIMKKVLQILVVGISQGRQPICYF
jgi:chorismate mutase